MVTISCPWCDEDELFAWLELAEPAASFTCSDCGTSIEFDDSRAAELDLAA